MHLTPQKSPLPLETMSQFTEPVIPDERRFAGRDPESSESSITSFDIWFPAFAGTLSGSRLASAAGGLGRDDELRHSLLAIRSESSNSGTDVSTRKDFVFLILDAGW
jgi:hypothetical protein